MKQNLAGFDIMHGIADKHLRLHESQSYNPGGRGIITGGMSCLAPVRVSICGCYCCNVN